MWPITTDRVAWSVICLCVTAMSPPKTVELMQVPFYDVDSGGPKELCIRWGSRYPTGRGTFEGDDIGSFRMVPSTVRSGPDIGISSHAVDQHSDWQAAEAVKCRIKFSK